MFVNQEDLFLWCQDTQAHQSLREFSIINIALLLRVGSMISICAAMICTKIHKELLWSLTTQIEATEDVKDDYKHALWLVNILWAQTWLFGLSFLHNNFITDLFDLRFQRDMALWFHNEWVQAVFDSLQRD